MKRCFKCGLGNRKENHFTHKSHRNLSQELIGNSWKNMSLEIYVFFPIAIERSIFGNRKPFKVNPEHELVCFILIQNINASSMSLRCTRLDMKHAVGACAANNDDMITLRRVIDLTRLHSFMIAPPHPTIKSDEFSFNYRLVKFNRFCMVSASIPTKSI